MTFAASMLFMLGVINDPDFFWHLKTGEWIWQHKGIPDGDPFNFMTPAATDGHVHFTLTAYWLTQVIYHLTHRLLGMPGIAVLKFRSGALGIIEATTATSPKDLEGSISILGENGTVEIGGFAVNEMKVWNFKDPRPDDADVVGTYRVNPPDVYGFGHVEYLRNVSDSIRSNKKALVDGLEGRRSLEQIMAIYESIEALAPAGGRRAASADSKQQRSAAAGEAQTVRRPEE